ncbi:MAG: antibiotic ABC transporter [Paracoccaceae bacterium]
MGFLTNNMAEATRLWAQVAQIAIESQMVIGLRMAGMMGLLPQHHNEPHRMVQEKLDAAQESGKAMFRAVTRGAPAEKVMAAALRPYGRRTRANARRLSKSSTRALG